MSWLLILLQIAIALSMFDIWWWRYETPGIFRGGDATTMVEEFEHYGLPAWFRNLVRVLKLSAAVLMLVGIWYPVAAFVAAVVLIVLMAGAMTMHFKVRDPLFKSLPSFSFFLLNAIVAYATRGALGL
jgi:uncharacterized membrane protein YphA (DoxX/SURF4 family)